MSQFSGMMNLNVKSKLICSLSSLNNFLRVIKGNKVLKKKQEECHHQIMIIITIKRVTAVFRAKIKLWLILELQLLAPQL
jgi:hypothetical protein